MELDFLVTFEFLYKIKQQLMQQEEMWNTNLILFELSPSPPFQVLRRKHWHKINEYTSDLEFQRK
jgi:hypothetical protein